MLHIIQNDPEVPLGTYADCLADLGIPFHTCHPYTGVPLPDHDTMSALIVLGGGMGVHDTERHPFLRQLKDLIRMAVAMRIPFLGICLGGQLLAEQLGAEVTSFSPYGEKGTVALQLTADGKVDPLFSQMGEEIFTFQWHNDSFGIPQGASSLAFTKECPHQAFRYGPAAYGVQFHPEVDRDIVAEWCSWSPETAAGTQEYLAGFDNHAGPYSIASRQLLINFLRIAGLTGNEYINNDAK